VFLNLHGAGLEADDPQLTHSLDGTPDLPAWTIFPSGVTPWSGDDWHQWGWADVEAAVSAIPAWIEAVGWDGPQVAADEWLVAGHSNGGQGIWYALTHKPDNIIAAAPISGYLSIQSYVPFHLWREVDPRLLGVVHAATSSFRHEPLISNARGIPIFQQHGGADDNVPPYHSRRMNQLISEADWAATYYEVPEEGHWFDGIMTTSPLRRFYHEQLRTHSIQQGKSTKKDIRYNFTLTVSNPGETGPKEGLFVEQVCMPGQLANIKATWSGDSLSLSTSNVRRLGLSINRPTTVTTIDGQNVELSGGVRDSKLLYQRDAGGIWQVKLS